ncbi:MULTISPECIES: hypothetical protein [Enterobacteriaceae]|uniref:hypothetical protein n=1 Tax=Enterobacteriaceae TaxID=543 RepID=UPI001F561F3C|nr:hypothetical protein [Escherichia coli]MDO5405036.1 hypothetical protein [Proteus sp. (in: enterobacteria)]
MSASAKSYAVRTVIIGGLVLFAGLCVASVLALLNIADTQEKQLSLLDQRLQAVEMTMADPVTDDGMNAQLDVIRQELATLKQGVASQRDTLRTVTEKLAVAGKPDEQITLLSDGLEKRLAQLETRQAQWALALHQLQEQRQPVQKTVNPPVVRVKNATPETSRPGASVRASRTVPFQLTAIEQRGGRRLAALAPADIRQLGQVQLVPVGGRYQGWEMTDIQTDRVTLRYQGRTVTLRLP